MSQRTEDDCRERAASVFTGVEYGPQQLLTVTDAEILALDGPHVRRLTPLLSLGPTIPEIERITIVDEAAARLSSTGRTEDGTPVGDNGYAAEEPTVRTVLRMRRSWQAVLMIDQRTAADRQWVTVYLRADGRALAESATSDGRHTFSSMKRAAALDRAVGNLMPFSEDADLDGVGRTYRVRNWHEQAAETLSRAKVASTVITKRHDGSMRSFEDGRLAIYNLANRTEVLVGESGGRVRICPIARRTLRRRLDYLTPVGSGDHDG